jgi:hypothetical protein
MGRRLKMKYFNSLPVINNQDSFGNVQQLKNLVVRTKLINKLSDNPLIYYKYTVQESDTPEIVAYKYYGDSYRYWLVLLANEALDPLWSWPLTSRQFGDYLKDKYSAAAGLQPVIEYTQLTTHHYEKLITTYDDSTQTTVVKNVIIDEDAYTSLMEKTTTKSFSYGANITYTISKKSVSIYDYEDGLNEAKRDIKLINSNYVSDLETQFQVLMGL